jgi:hypothetical protein
LFALFAWLISHQPAVLFSYNKPAISNQPAVLFSQNKSAPAISHQPTEQARCGWLMGVVAAFQVPDGRRRLPASFVSTGSIPIGMDKYNKKIMIVTIRDPDLFRVEN